ncbi:caspase domain-containing protein [Macrophomina phaseolina]|uniref:Caspase domain-containing protein n=1 Tax=Macrophomina phaseolina TaxID=35725 RepID=A0ABQ8FYJ0_9PEZI|nr:caspase domain-containing protein [Macrophomina phaseolina]
MSYYPGQGYHGGGYGGPPPPPQQYGAPPQGYPPQQYGPPQGQYGYPPPAHSPQPPYGYGTPPPGQYGGYQQVTCTDGKVDTLCSHASDTSAAARIWLRTTQRPNPTTRPVRSPGIRIRSMFLLREREVSSIADKKQGGQGAPPPPPQQAQSFGHGAPSGYSFQYSNCTGRRKALLIGINYFGQRGQLRGCINDVKNMSNYLNQHFGYKREDMVTLTDDQQNPMSQPTKANILRAMHWLVKDARPNDSLFFHYSGHGGQTKDLDGDEDDGYDEVIYPVDFRQAGHIVDDEMHRIMVQSLQPGVRLTAIFDSCHSGSALDLPYIYSTSGVLKEPNLAKEAGQGLLGIVSSYARGDLGGMASTAMGLFKKATTGDETYKRNLRTKTSPADVIMWSGSKDTQTSSDATIGGQATGAMSWAFITSLKKNPQQSYVQLLNSIRDELEGKYSQKPQLSCSHPLNTNLLFVM